MLDIKLIREQPEKIKQGISKKGADISLVDKVLELDKKKRDLLQEIEKVRAKKNTAEKKITGEKNKEGIMKVLKDVKIFLSGKEKEFRASGKRIQTNNEPYSKPSFGLCS